MNIATSILALLACVLLLLGLLREAHKEQRRRWGVLVLLLLTAVVLGFTYTCVTHGWAIAVLAVAVVGLHQAYKKRKRWWWLLIVCAFALAVAFTATGGTTYRAFTNAKGVCTFVSGKDKGQTAKGYIVKKYTSGAKKGKAVVDNKGRTPCIPKPAPKPPAKKGKAATTTAKKSNNSSTLSDAEALKRTCDLLKAVNNGNFPCDKLKAGSGVNFDNHTEVRGSAAFSKVTLKTPADIAAFLASSDPRAIAARARLKRVLAPFPGEYQRALKGEGYVPIQFGVAVQYLGTTYFADSVVIDEEGPRQVPANDILWLFFTRQGIIIPGASIRADCGNENFNRIVPVTPSTPPAPPINVPPSPKELKNCRGKDPDPTTDTKLCDPTGGTDANRATYRRPQLPPNSNVPVQTVGEQETPTTVGPGGTTNSPVGTNTGNGTTGSSGTDNGSSGGSPPAQGVTHPQPHPGTPGTTTPPAGTLPQQCTNPSDPACGTGTP